ncbi:hypothetical protein OE165_27040, partial [Escherichia coli]|uniref:hypothetical protein n=1 Tax=Escherichia coli TaxID=562 RepID=UPI0021F26510
EQQPLHSRCNYSIEGEIPAARLFTLHAQTLNGERIIATEPLKSALHSDEILFGANTFTVSIAASAQPGNWITLGAAEPFKLVLSYYDVAVIN